MKMDVQWMVTATFEEHWWWLVYFYSEYIHSRCCNSNITKPMKLIQVKGASGYNAFCVFQNNQWALQHCSANTSAYIQDIFKSCKLFKIFKSCKINFDHKLSSFLSPNRSHFDQQNRQGPPRARISRRICWRCCWSPGGPGCVCIICRYTCDLS